MRPAWALPFMLVVLMLGCTGSGSSSTPFPRKQEAVTIVAADRLFEVRTIKVEAGSRVTIKLMNLDADPHNIAFYKSDAAEEEIFVSETISGRGTETSGSFDAPPPGRYFFRCDVHPVTMTGDFLVQ